MGPSRNEVLQEKLKLLSSIMEKGQLTLEEWDLMLSEMEETYNEIIANKKQTIN